MVSRDVENVARLLGASSPGCRAARSPRAGAAAARRSPRAARRGPRRTRAARRRPPTPPAAAPTSRAVAAPALEAVGVDRRLVAPLLGAAAEERERQRPLLAHAPRARRVEQDLEDPGAQRRAALEPVDPLDHADPGVLDDLLGDRPARHVQRAPAAVRAGLSSSTSAANAASSPSRSASTSSASSGRARATRPAYSRGASNARGGELLGRRLTETTRPLRAGLNSTTPARVAKIVWSRPRPAPSPGRKRVPRWRTRISPPLDLLAGEDLDAEHLRVRVAAVAARAESLLVSHR